MKNNFFLIKVAESKLGFSRFGVVVSGKVLKSATKRNQIKRLIYWHISARKLHLKPGKDVMITVLSKAKGLSRDDLISALRELIIKL